MNTEDELTRQTLDGMLAESKIIPRPTGPSNIVSYWYAPLDGAKLTFRGGPQPKPGDLLVVDVFAAEEDVLRSRFPHRTLVQTITHKYRFGRTMGAGMGLYSNTFGYWMWGFGDSEKDRYELWRID